jgi:hypothetical protein
METAFETCGKEDEQTWVSLSAINLGCLCMIDTFVPVSNYGLIRLLFSKLQYLAAHLESK